MKRVLDTVAVPPAKNKEPAVYPRLRWKRHPSMESTVDGLSSEETVMSRAPPLAPAAVLSSNRVSVMFTATESRMLMAPPLPVPSVSRLLFWRKVQFVMATLPALVRLSAGP